MPQNNTIDTVEVRKEYYPSGALSCETPFVNGYRHGISRDYDRDNSNIYCLTLYNKDREVAIVVSYM